MQGRIESAAKWALRVGANGAPECYANPSVGPWTTPVGWGPTKEDNDERGDNTQPEGSSQPDFALNGD